MGKRYCEKGVCSLEETNNYEKKKILFIINTFTNGGGAEKLLASIVNNLNPDKYEIGIFEIIHCSQSVEDIKPNILLHGYYVKEDDPYRKEKMYYVYHEWEKVINEFIPREYDVYISFNYLKPTFLLPVNKPSIAWIHGDVYNLQELRLKEEKELQTLAFNNVNRIIAISDRTEQSVKTVFPEISEKVKKIYNGIDINYVRVMSEMPIKDMLEPVAILFIGRLDENKDPLRAYSIFKLLHKEIPNANLYFIGEGSLREKLENMILIDGLQKSVHLLGYYDNPFPIIKQAKVTLMTSKSEGFSLALLESLALGIPIVSSRCGAAETMCNHNKCGKVFDKDSEAVDALCSYLLNKDNNCRELANECMKHAEFFGLNRFIQQVENEIDECGMTENEL